MRGEDSEAVFGSKVNFLYIELSTQKKRTHDLIKFVGGGSVNMTPLLLQSYKAVGGVPSTHNPFTASIQ